MPDAIVIAGAGLSAAISPHGAELQWLRDTGGRDLLWDGDPAFWTGRAPLLFPIVGRANGDVIRVDGVDYPMGQHGFARRRDFVSIAQDATSAHLRLTADAETRAVYPFDFALDVAFTIRGAALTMVATLSNPGAAPLPASFGYHPALRWPLPSGQPPASHRIVFAENESAPIRRIDSNGLLRPDPLPTPIAGRTLRLDDALFGEGALILDRIVSRRLVYGVPGAPALEIDFPDMDALGIWTKPGAGYLCIEPWVGHADPAGFVGELRDKPGIITVPPGGSRAFTMRIARAAEPFE